MKRVTRLVLLLSVALCCACSESDESLNDVVDSGSEDVLDAEFVDEVVCGTSIEQRYNPYEMAELEGCDILVGWLRFGDTGDIIDLSQAPSLRVIEGGLNLFRNPQLVSVDGVEKLERVGNLIIHHNDVLVDLSSLSNLRRVDDELYIADNRNLSDLQGLENLRFVSGLSIQSNSKLQSLDGLSGLERVAGDLTITGNSALSQGDIQAFLDGIEIDGEINIGD